MSVMKSLKVLHFLAPALLFATGCAVEKSENPLTPTVAGPIAGVEISAPKPLEPAAGAQIPGDRQPVTLLLENALTSGPRPLNYVFEVATDAGFSNRVFAQDRVPPGDAGRTSLRLPDALNMGRVYFWRAKAQDGANEGPYSPPVNFNVFTPVGFDKPLPISPINNEKISTQRPNFRFSNAPRVGSPASVSYVIEVATTDSFASKIAAWQLGEAPNETTFAAAQDLPDGSQLFWHVRAFEGSVLGPWSDTAVFRTPTLVAPTPSPSPGPSGGQCSGTTDPLTIVQCQRARFPTPMSAGQILTFLQGVASDLNTAKVPEGPFGILQKTGSQCGGYSCDIICSGNGSSQRQWDVLIAGDPGVGSADPTWHRLDGAIVVRQCDVVQ